MHRNFIVLGLTSLLALSSGTHLRADVKSAAGVLKSTVYVEWTAEEKKEASKTQEVQKDGPQDDQKPAAALDASPHSDASAQSQPAAKEDRATKPSCELSIIKFNSSGAVTFVPQATDAETPNADFATRYLGVLTSPNWGNKAISVPLVKRGTGVIVSSNGLIVINLQISQPGQFTVTLEDGRKFTTSHSVIDQRSGLRMLKIDAVDLPAVTLSLDPLEIGQDVIAGQCVDAQNRSLRRGVIVGKNRTVVGPCSEVIPCDVPSWSSMEGAPLVNPAGELIGIVSKLEEAPADGMNFAVPARFVKLLMESHPTPEQSVIHKGYLGVQLWIQESKPTNIVERVIDDSPAAKAGVKAKDEILSIDGISITSHADVIKAVSQHQGGDKIAIHLKRGGQDEKLEVTLSDFPQQYTTPVAVDVVSPTRVMLLSPDASGVLRFTPHLVQTNGLGASVLTPPVPTEGPAKAITQYVLPQSAPNPNEQGGVLRVERSDIGQKLDDLKGQVDALKTEVSKLNKVLEQLEKKLQPQS